MQRFFDAATIHILCKHQQLRSVKMTACPKKILYDITIFWTQTVSNLSAQPNFEVVQSNSSLNDTIFSLKIHGKNKESVNFIDKVLEKAPYVLAVL